MGKLMVDLIEPELASAPEPLEYIVPPKWAVRLVSTNHGKKGKHYPLTWTRSYQTYPQGAYDADDVVDAWGPMGIPTHRHNEENWRAAYAKRKAEEEEELNKKIIRGNLKEEQYRFWNGSQGPSSSLAVCRWCKQWCYGQEEMRRHQEQTDHDRILAAIYECARGHRLWHCFTCGGHTKHQHWGIPLCPGNKCRNRWRTAPIGELSHMLLMYAKLSFAKGLLKDWLREDKSEKFNIDPNPKKFNWERAEFC